MIVAPSYQIQGLLEYLRAALRADPDLLALGYQPDDLVAGILDAEPDVTGRVPMYLPETPALCAREVASEPVWGGQGRGIRAAVSLWYVVQHPAPDTVAPLLSVTTDSLPVPPRAAAERLARCVWWRVMHYLHTMTATIGTTTVSLETDCQVEAVVPTGRATYRHDPAGWLLAEWPLEMTYYLPPYAAPNAQALDGIDATLYDQTGAPPTMTDGVSAGMNWDSP